MLVRVIYTDLEKAFDKIPKKEIVNKTQKLLHRNLIYWIECFML